MGKPPGVYTDSETEDTSCCSSENVKKKKKFSILKYTNGDVKKKKCRWHTKTEQDESDCRNGSNTSQRVRYKLPGILKYDTERHRYCEHDVYNPSPRPRPIASDEDDDSEPIKRCYQSRCLVGQVPSAAGQPGRGGGVSIVIRRNVSTVPQQDHFATRKNILIRRELMKKKLTFPSSHVF